MLPRLVAMIGFQPAVLFRLDTYDYLWGAVHVAPNVVNPSGYSLFLWLLRPFHSIVLVVALQHLLGLGIATLVYALVRRYGLPDWGATLAAAPVLFDPAQILVEQFVMADLLAMALMIGAFGVSAAAQAAVDVAGRDGGPDDRRVGDGPADHPAAGAAHPAVPAAARGSAGARQAPRWRPG